MPRRSTAAGMPRAARSVPGGVRLRNAGSVIAMPAMTRGRPGHGRASVSPAIVRPGADRQQDRERQPPARVDGDVVLALGGGAGRDRGDRGTGHRGGDRDQRQQAEEDEPPVERLGDDRRDERPEHAGQHPRRRQRREHRGRQPLRQGSARSRRRRPPGSRRPRGPGAPVRRRGSASIGARPPTSSPIAEQAEPDQERPGQRAPRSIRTPATTIPSRLPRKKPENTQPYRARSPAASSRGDDRHDRRDGEGLGGDERDRQDQADRQRTMARRPETGRLRHRLGGHGQRMRQLGQHCRQAGTMRPPPARTQMSASRSSGNGGWASGLTAIRTSNSGLSSPAIRLLDSVPQPLQR